MRPSFGYVLRTEVCYHTGLAKKISFPKARINCRYHFCSVRTGTSFLRISKKHQLPSSLQLFKGLSRTNFIGIPPDEIISLLLWGFSLSPSRLFELQCLVGWSFGLFWTCPYYRRCCSRSLKFEEICLVLSCALPLRSPPPRPGLPECTAVCSFSVFPWPCSQFAENGCHEHFHAKPSCTFHFGFSTFPVGILHPYESLSHQSTKAPLRFSELIELAFLTISRSPSSAMTFSRSYTFSSNFFPSSAGRAILCPQKVVESEA